MSKIKITKKFALVKVPEDDADYKALKITAFQVVEFEVNFFGAIQTFTLDTKILEDGSQFVIGGNGLIPDNFNITNM